MRKIFAAIILGLFLIPQTDASWRRSRPVYSFQRAEQSKSKRYTRKRWRRATNRHQYRFSSAYKRDDRLRWKNARAGVANSDADLNPDPIQKDFCNYHNSIIGEYLPSKEVKNRCCVCLDGWKCEYSTLAGSNKPHYCTPDWKPANTTGEPLED